MQVALTIYVDEEIWDFSFLMPQAHGNALHYYLIICSVRTDEHRPRGREVRGGQTHYQQ